MAFNPFRKAAAPVPVSVPAPPPQAVPNDKSIVEKGEEGEKTLAEWFSANGLAYVAICQNKETFAEMFKDEVKRPDFFVLFDSLGMIAVDAKNLTPYRPKEITYYSLPLEDELKKAIAFERIFRMPVWYAVMEKDGEQAHWYWISALKAIETGYVETNNETKVQFLKIKRDHFVKISTGDDLAKLYLQRLPSTKKLFDLPIGT